MVKIEVILFEENYQVGACIGALRIAPFGKDIARIYKVQDGSYYTMVNDQYEFKPCYISKEKLDEYFKNSKRTINDEVSYVADIFKADLEKQIEQKSILFIPSCNIHITSPFVNKTLESYLKKSVRCTYKKVQSSEIKKPE